MKQLFDDSIDTERFSMASVNAAVFGSVRYLHFKEKFEEYFSPQISKKILQALIRFAFYIEPVKQPKIETTKFTVRWSASLENDPRQCSYENCVLIFDKLLNDLSAYLEDEEKRTMLEIIANNSLVSYELNIDYIERIENTSIHNVENISFFWENAIRQVYLLRRYLLDSGNHDYVMFFSQTYDKIAVKSFLTDRVLTGIHKTNREKRWECHPGSVHFALRRECLAIEVKLIKQICHLDGFPVELRTLLSDNNVIIFSDEITKCPITLDLLSFEKFQNEVLNPVMGKSSFQVGHLHPLKSIEENLCSGHTADNISWISFEGNRIQGDLSVEETRSLILRIIDNYKAAGIIE